MAAMHEASLLRGRSGGAGMRISTLKIALDARRATRGGPAAIAARQQARLAELVARSIVSVNREFAFNDDFVRPTDEVALFPPVSGGGA